MNEFVNNTWDFLVKNYERILQIFNTSLFDIGKSPISLSTIIYFFFAFFLLIFLAGRTKRLLVNNLLAKANIEVGARASIGTITRLIILTIGSIMIVESAGIDMSALS
jgi:small-conductance mechanosensitive channel